MDDLNPQQELKRIEELIESATELAALRPAFYRLEQLIKTFPGDFDVQVTGSDLKARLIARGTLLKQQAELPPLVSRPPEMGVVAPPLPVSSVSAPEAVPEVPLEPPIPVAPVPTFLPPPPESPAPPLAALPESAPQAVEPPIPAPPRPNAWKLRAVLLAAVAFIAVLVASVSSRQIREHILQRPVPVVAIDVTTTPPGASVRVEAKQPKPGARNETGCLANCKLSLEPGAYQFTASLDGFDPAAAAVIVKAGQPMAVRLALTAQEQSVRLLTDLERGKVVIDDRPPADLQDGQMVLDKLPPGSHSVTVTGPSGSAAFSFTLADGQQPVVAGPVQARNMIAVLVASLGSHARVVTSAGPWKLSLNGVAQSDAAPAGADLVNFHPGVNEIVIGEGKDQRNMSDKFGAAPMLTAFLKTDVNAGTLIVSAGQDDASVFLNNKEYRRHTQRGEVRIQTLGKVTVRVAKAGFLDEPPQTAEVQKGAEVRLQFDLKPQPQFGTLEIRGAVAGTELFIDQKDAGTVGPDGALELASIQPGDHTLELRHEQYQPKRLQRSFRAGQAVTLAGADVALLAANGIIRLTRNPASASIAYRRGDETESHDVHGNQVELPPGSYAFSASAPGFTSSTVHVQLAPGENREIQLALARERPAAPPPVTASGMSEFEDQDGWKKDGDTWIRKGGGFLPYKLSPKGVFSFTVNLVKAGKFRWCVQWLDAKNYLLYEIDRKEFWAGVVDKGKRYERVKVAQNLGNQRAFTIQVEVTPESAVQRVRVGQDWKVLDTFVEPGRDFTKGKFGFLVQGSDEISISDFSFRPR